MEFPKTLYHEAKGAVTVATAEAEAALGAGWHAGEHFFTKIVAMPHEAWTALKDEAAKVEAAVESSLADAAEAVENAAQKAAKAVRKTKKTAPETSQV
jgi:ribulose 1,5-bisphosphate synthetase/thiazole synthase